MTYNLSSQSPLCILSCLIIILSQDVYQIHAETFHNKYIYMCIPSLLNESHWILQESSTSKFLRIPLPFNLGGNDMHVKGVNFCFEITKWHWDNFITNFTFSIVGFLLRNRPIAAEKLISVVLQIYTLSDPL